MSGYYWIYIMAAYGVGLLGTLGVTAWSWLAMLRAEARRDAVRGNGRDLP